MTGKPKTKRKTKNFDWSVADAMTDAERAAAIASDPDASVPTDAQLASARRVHDRPLSHQVRFKLRLSQAEFAKRYDIPLGTIRDWDQGRTEPDAAGRALLKAIAAYPDEVAKAQATG